MRYNDPLNNRHDDNVDASKWALEHLLNNQKQTAKA